MISVMMPDGKAFKGILLQNTSINGVEWKIINLLPMHKHQYLVAKYQKNSITYQIITGIHAFLQFYQDWLCQTSIKTPHTTPFQARKG